MAPLSLWHHSVVVPITAQFFQILRTVCWSLVMGRNSENDLIYFRPFNKNNLEFHPSIFTDLRFYIKEDFHRQGQGRTVHVAAAWEKRKEKQRNMGF